MQGVRHFGYLRFILALERHWGTGQLWEAELTPLRYIVENGDPQVVKVQGQEACIALWSLLRRLPETVSHSDEVVFLLGYVPLQHVPLEPEDAARLKTWQGTLRQLFRWATTFDWHAGSTTESFETFREDLLNLVDGVDDLVTPCLSFWSEVRRRQTGTR